MRYYLLLLFSIALALPAAAQQRPVPADTLATRVQVRGADCALFPATISSGKSFEKMLSASGRFTPTIQEVATSEKALSSLNILKICAQPIEPDDSIFATTFKQSLTHYRRQYYGFYNSQREPCFYINFFRREIRKDDSWLKYRVHLIDAGFSIWSVSYNLTTRKFYDFNHEFSNRF